MLASFLQQLNKWDSNGIQSDYVWYESHGQNAELRWHLGVRDCEGTSVNVPIDF